VLASLLTGSLLFFFSGDFLYISIFPVISLKRPLDLAIPPLGLPPWLFGALSLAGCPSSFVSGDKGDISKK